MNEIPKRPPSNAVLASVALLAMLLHAFHALIVVRSEGCEAWSLACPAYGRRWTSPDTEPFLRVAYEIREQGLFGADYLYQMPGYPLLLDASIALTGRVTPALWAAVLLAGLAAAAVAWIAGHLTRRNGPALAAGLLLCLWFSSYQYASVLLADAVHGYLAVAALAATLAWRARERAGAALLAAGLWLSAQAIRATFAPLAALLPVMLWRRGSTQRYRRISAALWVATLLVPAGVTVANWHRHGVATVSAKPALGLACEALPRLKEKLGMDGFTLLRRRCLARYGELPARERIPTALAEWRAFVSQYPREAMRSHAAEIAEQLLAPMPLDYHAPRRDGPFPRWAVQGSGTVAVFWLCALGGLVALSRAQPQLVAFLVLSWLCVMLPASNVNFAGARYRFVLDLFFMPLVVYFLDAAWRAARLRSSSARSRAQGNSTD